MMQKLLTFNFKWVEDILQYNEVFKKNYDEKGEVGCILEVDVKYPEKNIWTPWRLNTFTKEKKKLKTQKACNQFTR